MSFLDLVPLEIISFVASPFSCLLQSNKESELICTVRGLPDPIITYQFNNDDLIPLNSSNTTNSVTGITTSRITINNANNGGLYSCNVAGLSPGASLPIIICSK